MPKSRSAIALFFFTTSNSGNVFEPENLFYLLPNSVYWCFEETTGRQFFLLRLMFGRNYEDVELFMQELMLGHPLMIDQHVIIERTQWHLIAGKSKDIIDRPSGKVWNLNEQCKASPFKTAEAYFAWIMTKVIWHFNFFFFGKLYIETWRRQDMMPFRSHTTDKLMWDDARKQEAIRKLKRIYLEP